MTADGGYGIWVYEATIVNAAGASGDHTYQATFAAGDVGELLYGSVFNGDTVARVVDVDLYVVSTRARVQLIDAYSLAAAGSASFPRLSSTSLELPGSAPILVPSVMTLNSQIAGIAISQDSAILLCMLIYGQKPTVAMTYPASATPTVVTNEVY